MGIEIERKFLVVGDAWRQAEPTPYCQGYLNRDKERTVRVRVAGTKGFLTIKGVAVGLSRAEFEYAIPLEDAKAMLALSDGPVVEKHRHLVVHGGMTWEVDEFHGDNAGLIVAEVELESEEQRVELPPWVGEEVTDDPRYFNARLAVTPFKSWPENRG